MAKEVGIDAECDILCRYEGWVEPLERFAAFAFAAGAKAAQPKSYEEQRAILIQYLQVMIARCDWHGVADVAMDLREMEAEQRGAK